MLSAMKVFSYNIVISVINMIHFNILSKHNILVVGQQLLSKNITC